MLFSVLPLLFGCPTNKGYVKKLKDVEKDIEKSYDAMESLYDEILVFLMKLPSSLQIIEGLGLIKKLKYSLDPSFRHAIKVRH